MSINKKRYHDSMTGRGQFAIVPNELWNLQLDVYCKSLWAYLISMPSNWDSSRNNIARNLGISKDKTSETLKILEGHNMLRIEVAGDGAWNIDILPPEEWVGPDQKQSRPGPNMVQAPDQIWSTYNKREEENKKSTLTIESIYQKWISEIPEKKVWNECEDELKLLFGAMKAEGLTPESLTSSFKKKILRRWSGSKYPDKQDQAWDRAIGEVFLSEVSLRQPKIESTRLTGELDVDTAIRITTPDDDIQKILADFEKIRNQNDD